MKLNEYRLKNAENYFEVNCCDFSSDDIFLDSIAVRLEKGIDILTFNGSSVFDKKFVELGKKLRELCSFYNTIYLIKGRIDVAKLVEADGVVLDENDIDISDAKKLLDEISIFGFEITDNGDYKEYSHKEYDFFICEKPLNNFKDFSDKKYFVKNFINH